MLRHFVFMVLAAGVFACSSFAAMPTSITIDGNFSDWAAVRSYSDPAGGPGVLHNGIPDTHDTDGSLPTDVPAYVEHPDIDLLEYKVAHDSENLYAYFRATGEIGRTQTAAEGKAGRYYVIVTIDVDNSETTGYPIHEGGYYPTSDGYDMNMEIEFYDGAFNTGHYLNHGALNQAQLDQAVEDQKTGVVNVLPGTYDYYSQWVWWDDTTSGDYVLPGDEASITFVADKGDVYQGIIECAVSADGHELEMVAPLRGFMKDVAGNPIIGIGDTINLSFSLEASGELATGDWASDTGGPIVSYTLSVPEPTTMTLLMVACLPVLRRRRRQ